METASNAVAKDPFNENPEAQEALIAKLDALGDALSRKRKRAIEGRTESGIEQIWLEDQDAFDGVDDANRAEEHSRSRYRYAKPQSTTGTSSQAQASPQRSTVYLNITAAYVEGASARVSDMLLPSDDRPWAIDPTPIPELVDAAAAEDENRTVEMDGQELPLKDVAAKALEIAKQKAERAQTRIDDWLTECDWRTHVRECLEDAARMGTGILKGPFPVNRKKHAWKRDDKGVTLEVHEETKPASVRVDCWNVYPDPACGESVHNGNFLWERDDITKKTLRDLREQPGYIRRQIDACLAEGPLSPAEVIEPTQQQQNHLEDTPFEIWRFYGFVEREDMEAAGCDCGEFDKDPHAAVPAIITMVNHRVIKAALNPLDTGAFPFDFIVWKKRRGMPWGMGVARQVRTPQRMVNAATRNLMDNAGLSGGPQIVIMRGVVTPADNAWELTPRKLWYADPDTPLQDLKQAFLSVNIDCNQADLLAIVEFALKMAEQVTGMPAIVQGQQGDAPELVGVVTIMNNNANSVLRRIARTFDNTLFSPHIERYHVYLMQHGEDEEEKGLFVVSARGSSVLVERDIQNQAILQMSAMALNPAFRIDPNKYSDEALKAQRLDPTRFKYDDAEWQKMQEEAGKQPDDPRITVAQMMAALKTQLQDSEQKYKAAEAEREAAREAEENRKDRELAVLIETMQHHVTAAELAGNKEISVEEIKAALAKTVISERSKASLQAREIKVKQAEGSGI